MVDEGGQLLSNPTNMADSALVRPDVEVTRQRSQVCQGPDACPHPRTDKEALDRRDAMIIATKDAILRGRVSNGLFRGGIPSVTPGKAPIARCGSVSTRYDSRQAPSPMSPRSVSVRTVTSPAPSFSTPSDGHVTRSVSSAPFSSSRSSCGYGTPRAAAAGVAKTGFSTPASPRLNSQAPSHQSFAVYTPRQGSFNVPSSTPRSFSSVGTPQPSFDVPTTPSMRRCSILTSDLRSSSPRSVPRDKSWRIADRMRSTSRPQDEEYDSQPIPIYQSWSRPTSTDSPRMLQPHPGDAVILDFAPRPSLEPRRYLNPANAKNNGSLPPPKPVGFGTPTKDLFWKPSSDIQKICDEMRTPSFVLRSRVPSSPDSSDGARRDLQCSIASVVARTCAKFEPISPLAAGGPCGRPPLPKRTSITPTKFVL
eukprot:TRINITY_DN45744_c0_g1_i1.p1 TRINITY_DN45744_c0_g1~~TRINITY_DN45744_c0_g1_i1.p1  ORF type:complete len:460 (+),score=30.10 TRINITY_DN45744_c0_g1_i1:117-1382(+)